MWEDEYMTRAEKKAIIAAAKKEAAERKRAKTVKECDAAAAAKIAAVKRKAAEELEAVRQRLEGRLREAEDTVSFLLPPKLAKDDYVERKAAKYL